MEQEEAADEHDNSQGAHSEHEVSPAHIVVLSAAGDSVTDYVAGGQVIRAAISGNEAPGNKTSDKLTNRPPYTQHGQEISGSERQEFQEKSSINRQITADTEAQAGEQSTDTNPCGTTTGGQTESTTNKEGHVEGWSTSDDI
jgi:hypothetical protein